MVELITQATERQIQGRVEEIIYIIIIIISIIIIKYRRDDHCGWISYLSWDRTDDVNLWSEHGRYIVMLYVMLYRVCYIYRI